MIKIIGKLCILFFLIPIFVIADVHMELQTTDGKELSHALVGQPFVVEVLIKGFSGTISEPKINTCPEVILKRTGLYMSSINGASTKKYSYLARVDSEGTFIVGPAIIEHNGYIYESDVYEIDVKSQPLYQKKSTTKRSKKNDVFLRITTDKESVYVGQKVCCTVRFYTNNKLAKIQALSPSAVVDATIMDMQGPYKGTEEIGGLMYEYIEWKWDMYPKRVGTLTIPAYSVDYQDYSKKRSGMSNFSAIFSLYKPNNRVYSNALSITVMALPKYDTDVFAVGTVDSFIAKINPGIAKEGEGIMLSITLTGDLNWQEVSFDSLIGIPESLKYYNSEVQLFENSDGVKEKKSFEFVIQGTESGNFEIPPQEFVYFDIEKHRYKTLQTAPLEVTITANPHFVQKPLLLSQVPPAKEKVKDIKKEMIKKLDVCCDEPFSKSKSTPEHIDWHWVYFFMFFPIIMYLSSLWYKRFFVQFFLYRYFLVYIRMAHALWGLQILEKKGDATKLYTLFTTFLGNQKIQSTCMLHEKKWEDFFSLITQIAFSKMQQDEKQDFFCYNKKQLFIDARAWIWFLRKKI